MDQPNEELISLLKELYLHGKYSDLMVTCGDDRYRVHKAIICPRSTFFAAACDGSFAEAQTSTIDLPGDDVQAVRMMIHYFYHLDYPYIPLHTNDQNPALEDMGLANAEERPSAVVPELAPSDEEEVFSSSLKKKKARRERARKGFGFGGPIDPPNMVIHAKVYAVAEKYAVEGLKATALNKFTAEAKEHWDSENFLQAATEAYTSTVENDRGIRDVVIATINEHSELLDRKDVQEVVKKLELAFDLLMQQRKARSPFSRW